MTSNRKVPKRACEQKHGFAVLIDLYFLVSRNKVKSCKIGATTHVLQNFPNIVKWREMQFHPSI